jgi:hypothetical protein
VHAQFWLKTLVFMVYQIQKIWNHPQWMTISFKVVFIHNAFSMGVYVKSLEYNYPYSEYGQTYLMNITMNKMLCNSLSFIETLNFFLELLINYKTYVCNTKTLWLMKKTLD